MWRAWARWMLPAAALCIAGLPSTRLASLRSFIFSIEQGEVPAQVAGPQSVKRRSLAVFLQVSNTSESSWAGLRHCLVNVLQAKGNMTADVYVSLVDRDSAQIPFDAEVSRGIEHVEREVQELVRSTGSRVFLSHVANKGADITKFFLQLQMAQPQLVDVDYELLLKVHTKTTWFWRDIMYDSLCGSSQQVQDIFQIFRSQPRLGMVGPWGLTWNSSTPNSLTFWGMGVHAFPEVEERRMLAMWSLLYPDKKAPSTELYTMCAGTMFWARPPPLLQNEALLQAIPELVDEWPDDAQSGHYYTGCESRPCEHLYGLERLMGTIYSAAYGLVVWEAPDLRSMKPKQTQSLDGLRAGWYPDCPGYEWPECLVPTTVAPPVNEVAPHVNEVAPPVNECEQLSCVPSMKVADVNSKLQVMGTAEGGATEAIQIMFNFLNITEKALAYSGSIDKYRTEVFAGQKEHQAIPCSECGREGWTCLKLLRNPLDRVVSSYIHTMETIIKGNIRQVRPDFSDHTSFAGFVDWLKFVAKVEVRVKGSDHYLPQCSCHYGSEVKYVLVESLGAGLAWFAQTERVQGLSRQNMSSVHFIAEAPEFNPRAAHLPYHQALHDSPPSYDSFLAQRDILRDVCCLFHHDVALYRQACSATWLQGCGECMESCAKELKRLARCDGVQ